MTSYDGIQDKNNEYHTHPKPKRENMNLTSFTCDFKKMIELNFYKLLAEFKNRFKNEIHKYKRHPNPMLNKLIKATCMYVTPLGWCGAPLGVNFHTRLRSMGRCVPKTAISVQYIKL